MLYFHFNDTNELDGISSNSPDHWPNRWESRHDFATMERAREVAEQATAFTGRLHIASDCGEWVSPRYDVVEAPKVGDAVSYAFNGDYYPDGEIVHVTKGTLRVIKTSTGGTYYKRGDRAAWIKKGGTWSLVPGHRSEWNREF